MPRETIERNFTSGPILGPLLRFAFPVLCALVLQAMYGAVDLLVVGQYGSSADVSAVATGSQLMATVTGMISAFSMGTTILLGRQIGEGSAKQGDRTIGASIVLFAAIGVFVTILIAGGARLLSVAMHAPAQAFEKTTAYIRICGAGAAVIVFYNLIGSVFRGIGDSKTPLVTVAIACAVNIIGDLILCGRFAMGARGATFATVAAQAFSVLICILILRKRKFAFAFSKKDIRFDRQITAQVTAFSAPVALQELLVGVSFLVIAAIVNALGLIPSAGVGVAEKVCMFIMLVPSAFMQSLAAIVAQNHGARKFDRAHKTLRIAIAVSFCAGVVMAYLAFFHGEALAGVFSKEPQVIAAGAQYLKAYAIDCLLTAFLFCFIGYFNGVGMTRFVMLQGLCGAFLVRVPLSFLMSKVTPVSLFRIELATPASTIVQILLCTAFLLYRQKSESLSV